MSVTISPSELFTWAVPPSSVPLLAFKHLWLWCHHCETTALFPSFSPLFVILCFWKFKDKKKKMILLQIKKKKNKPCKNVQDSYFIYIRFFFVFVNKMVGISLSLVVIPLLSVYWPIKTCFRLYTVLRLGFSLLCRTSDVCVCVCVCVFVNRETCIINELVTVDVGKPPGCVTCRMKLTLVFLFVDVL